MEFYCYFQQHVDLNKRGRFNVVCIYRTEIGLPKMVLIDLCYSVFLGVAQFFEVPIFFDKMFWRIFLTNSFGKLFEKIFFDEILINFDFRQIFLTYNLSTVLSFRIGVPSILFFQKNSIITTLCQPNCVFLIEMAHQRTYVQ